MHSSWQHCWEVCIKVFGNSRPLVLSLSCWRCMSHQFFQSGLVSSGGVSSSHGFFLLTITSYWVRCTVEARTCWAGWLELHGVAVMWGRCLHPVLGLEVGSQLLLNLNIITYMVSALGVIRLLQQMLSLLRSATTQPSLIEGACNLQKPFESLQELWQCI